MHSNKQTVIPEILGEPYLPELREAIHKTLKHPAFEVMANTFQIQIEKVRAEHEQSAIFLGQEVSAPNFYILKLFAIFKRVEDRLLPLLLILYWLHQLRLDLRDVQGLKCLKTHWY